MYFLKALFVFSLLCPIQGLAQVDPVMRVDWHVVGVSEHRGDWVAAREAYESVIEESKDLRVTVREWYLGTSYYGVARCNARLNAPEGCRKSLELAYEHHFWNTALVEQDSSLLACCGKAWIDSLGSAWSAIARNESSSWTPQEPIIFAPDSIGENEKLPIIVALHGGNANYQDFSQYWKSFPNQFRVIVAVPAGPYRNSDISNSWESDFDLIGRYLLSMLPEFYNIPHADSTHVYLMGFSQGAQASIELTLRHPERFRGAFSVSGFSPTAWTDSMLNYAKQRGVSIYSLSGEWEEPAFFAGIKRAEKECTDHQIPFYAALEPAMIHEIPLDLPARISEAWKWIRAHDPTVPSRP